MPKQYDIDRKEASHILGVSERTLDRYIRQKNLSTKKIGRRVYLCEEEVKKFKLNRFRSNYNEDDIEQEINIESDFIDVMQAQDNETSNSASATIEYTTPIYEDAEPEQITVKHKSTKKQDDDDIPSSKEVGFYVGIFEKLQQEIGGYQNQLQEANYKIGQLEGMLKSSVPLLDVKNKEHDIQKRESKLKKLVLDARKKAEDNEEKMKTEKINKNVVLFLLFAVLVMQPILWIVLQ